MMDASTDKSKAEKRRVFHTIAIIYVAWTVLSWLLLWAGYGMAINHFYAQLIVPLCVLFNICMAAFATAFFVARALPALKGHTGLRILMIGLCVAVSFSCWCYSRWTANSPPAFMFMLNTANLLIFANLVGTWITKPLKRPAELVPVSVVMVFADLFSVFQGPSKQMAQTVKNYYDTGMQGPPPAAEFILVKIAAPGLNQMLSVFGLADWVIVAFFTAATVKFSFNDNLAGISAGQMVNRASASVYLPVTAVGLFAAVLLAQFSGIFIPALPLVALFFMGYIMARYPDARRLTPSDWRITGVAVVVMGTLMGIYGYL